MLDAALVMLMDHGLTQSAVVARLVDELVPDDIQVPIAAGLLMVGNKYIGTMAGAGKLLAEGHAHAGDKRNGPRMWCAGTGKRSGACRVSGIPTTRARIRARSVCSRSRAQPASKAISSRSRNY